MGLQDASARLEAKRSIRQGQAAPDDRPPSFARVERVRSVKGSDGRSGEARRTSVALARRLSSTFRDFGHLQDSGVLGCWRDARASLGDQRGHRSRRLDRQFTVCMGHTQATDGMMLRHHVLFVENERAKLPGEAVMQAGIPRRADAS